MDNQSNEFKKHSKTGSVISAIGLVAILVSVILFIYFDRKKQEKLISKETALENINDTLNKTILKLDTVSNSLSTTDSLLTADLRNDKPASSDTNGITLNKNSIEKYKLIAKVTKGIVFIQIHNSIKEAQCTPLKVSLREAGFSVPEVMTFDKYSFTTQIKYFDEADKYKAEEISAIFARLFGWSLPVVKYNSSREGVLPNGQFEIWIYVLKPRRFPQASERLLSPEDLLGLSKSDLKIMRNEIYARYGYIFKTPDMKSYFAEQPWYTAKYEDVSQRLSSIENQNISLIKKYE